MAASSTPDIGESVVVPLTDAALLASYSPQPPAGAHIEIAQVEHRIHLINAFRLGTGSRVLEIGPGQGTCTTVLAHAVGERGHIDAVDPAPPDYGAPFTLAQAQDYVSASAVGSRISWHRQTPEAFLASFRPPPPPPPPPPHASETGKGVKDGAGERPDWDVAVLVHSVWYFRSPATLGRILAALKGRARRVCIAEYALHATRPAAVPHVFAALARGTAECYKAETAENIQTPLSPSAIKEMAAAAGWTVVCETEVVPEPGLSDGMWETGTVVRDAFLHDVQDVENERVRAVLRSARDATTSAAAAVGGWKKVQTMDVWAAVFSEDETT